MTSKLMLHLTFLFLVVSISFCKASSQDWVDYDDEDDGAYDKAAASWQRELVEVSPGSGAAAGYGMSGGYGGYGSGRTNPYGASPAGPSGLSPPPIGVLSPPPPPKAAVTSYSTSATVPGVKSTATLSAYANVAAFDTTERLRFTTALQSNIFSLLKTLANVTIDSVTPGSINVASTIAFTGSDSTEAASSAAALVTALNSGDTSVFGTSFGTIQVSGVSAANASNPTTNSGKSGASSTQWTFLPIAVAVVVISVATMTLVGTSC